MIDLKDLRENPDKYRRGAELKGVRVDIDGLLRIESDRVAAQQEFDKMRAEQNSAGKLISALKDPAEKQAAVAKLGELKTRLKSAEERMKAAEAESRVLLLQIPQPPDDDVPRGKDASDNVVLYKHGEPRKFTFKPKNHIQLGETLGILDFERGVRVGGTRSYFLRGAGAELHAAVLRLATDMMIYEQGFTLMSVPVLVREKAMLGTGFFPGGREQAYRVGEAEEAGDDVRFLTGTAEVSLTAFQMPDDGKVSLTEADLPLKYTAVSTCFRREAGAAGKDTAGLYRVHQFDKCEQVVLCRNDVEESKRWHKQMLGYSEQLLQRLELPYRVIQCCTGDIGVKNASMMDIETWMPSREQPGKPESGYSETHSASRLYDFQARRLDLKYRDQTGKIRFCHTLNNTVVASPRVLIPIIENHQNEDGSVTIPTILRPYMNGRDRIM